MTLLSVPLAIGRRRAADTDRACAGSRFYRTVYFLPVVTLPASIALVWKLLYNGDFGIVNWFARAWSASTDRHWLSDPHTAIYAIGIVSIWSSIGYNMVLLLAGMQAIPREYYEAADWTARAGVGSSSRSRCRC